jgi:hypothetical protein
MVFLSGGLLLNRAVINSAGNTKRRTCIFVRILVLLSAFLVASDALQSAHAQPATEEYKVKAAFLFHFAQLVEWPAGTLGAGDQSLNLCVFADEPHLQELQITLEGKPVETRVLHVLLLSTPNVVQSCNIVFLSRDRGWRQAAILKSLQGQPVLTVGETGNFLSDGGMIQLYLKDDKVRFDINAGVADSSHLRISSRLLLLATSVTEGDGAGRGRPNHAH